jgi:hypothetical protein
MDSLDRPIVISETDANLLIEGINIATMLAARVEGNQKVTGVVIPPALWERMQFLRSKPFFLARTAIEAQTIGDKHVTHTE